jgi:Flp pilus assembly protein TadG
MSGAGWATRRHRRRGLVALELAMITPVLTILLFAVCEFGFMFRSELQVNNIAREAARAAAAGETPTAIASQVTGLAGSLDQSRLTVTLQRRAYVSGSTWSTTWYTLGTSGTLNDASLHDIVRATAAYQHHLTFGGLFTFLLTNPSQGAKTLTSRVSMVRH